MRRIEKGDNCPVNQVQLSWHSLGECPAVEGWEAGQGWGMVHKEGRQERDPWWASCRVSGSPNPLMFFTVHSHLAQLLSGIRERPDNISFTCEITSVWVICTSVSSFLSRPNVFASFFSLRVSMPGVIKQPIGTYWMEGWQSSWSSSPDTSEHIQGLWPSGGHREDYNVPEHYLTVWISFSSLFMCTSLVISFRL